MSRVCLTWKLLTGAASGQRHNCGIIQHKGTYNMDLDQVGGKPDFGMIHHYWDSHDDNVAPQEAACKAVCGGTEGEKAGIRHPKTELPDRENHLVIEYSDFCPGCSQPLPWTRSSSVPSSLGASCPSPGSGRLTVVNHRDVLSLPAHHLVAWSVSVQDGCEGLLVCVAHHGGQACTGRGSPGSHWSPSVSLVILSQ